MYLEDIRDYCINKQEVTEGFPFDSDTLVFKVCGKIFLLSSLEKNTISLKFDPEMAIDLRERYSEVVGAFHMHKKYWNSIQLDGTIPSKLIYEWIDHSYKQTAMKLSRKDRALLSLDNLNEP
ncbi:MAG: MmcQ/YjbR family DNA-binding protein [Bacteroidales bacterium]|nr:MmcQ/YjbR family DNA-binding protein [Bacteroidales bacterium]